MTFLIVVASGVALLALVHLVVGWFVANGLHREMLAVRPRCKDLAVRVREVSSDRIVLEAPGPRQDTGHPGTLGLVWEGGHGRVGDLLDVDGTRFIRRFEPMRGMPPICVGELESCPPVELDPHVFWDPGDVCLPFQTVTYRSPLGDMEAWLVPGGSPDTWAIHCHGWAAERRELVRMLPTFNRHGLTSLVIDYRNDPDRPADPSARHQFGMTEWEDLEAAVQWVLDRGAEQVVLTGCSTGGALVMSFLERSRLAEAVTGIVLDAPNLVLSEVIRHGTGDMRATPLMIDFGMWIAHLRWGVDWEATNFVERASQILRIPVLVFHGTSDQTVPISVSRRLGALVPELVELVESPAAGHVLSWNANPERYERYLENFLDRI